MYRMTKEQKAAYVENLDDVKNARTPERAARLDVSTLPASAR